MEDLAEACDDDEETVEDLAEACHDDDETTSCSDDPRGIDCWAPAESPPGRAAHLHDAAEPDAFRLLEGFASTWPSRHEKDARFAAHLYADLSSWWSGRPQLAMAFLPKRPGEQWSSDHRQSAEATLHAVLKSASLLPGEQAPQLHLLEATSLCDRRMLPKTDALWCVTLGSAGEFYHSFLAAFNAATATVRVENSRKPIYNNVDVRYDLRPLASGGFSFADWRGKSKSYGGHESAHAAYGAGQWLLATEWQDTFLESLRCGVEAMAVCDSNAACDVAEACFGFRDLCGVWSSMRYPHIVVIEVCRKAALSQKTPSPARQLAPSAAQPGAGPSVQELLDGPVADWLRKGPNRCHQAAELHRRLAAKWPKSAWRSLVFLKGVEWEDAYVASVSKICSARKMAKNTPIPPAAILPTTALCEATAPPRSDALYCVSIGFLESGFRFATLPHPRHFHTFMLYYDAASRSIRTENAWENRYTFAAWRDEEEELDPIYCSARLRFGGGRWLPHTLWQQHFWSQLILAIESLDFLGARDHFEHCFGVRPSVELQGYSQFPYVLIEEVIREESS